MFLLFASSPAVPEGHHDAPSSLAASGGVSLFTDPQAAAEEAESNNHFSIKRRDIGHYQLVLDSLIRPELDEALLKKEAVPLTKKLGKDRNYALFQRHLDHLKTEGDDKCLGFGFGAGNEPSFENYIAKHYGCEMHGFDPAWADKGTGGKAKMHSTGLGKHHEVHDGLGKVSPYRKLKEHFDNSSRRLAFFKANIDGNEWDPLSVMTDAELDNIDQLLIELHLTKMQQRFKKTIMPVVRRLKEKFAVYHSHVNACCDYSNITSETGNQSLFMPRCFELSMINRNKLRKWGIPTAADLPGYSNNKTHGPFDYINDPVCGDIACACEVGEHCSCRRTIKQKEGHSPELHD